MLKFCQIDAFTDQPFKGNPAAVFVTYKPLDENLMQLIANEMNLSETAFLSPLGENYSLRWFTPTTEVDLCGHATLASAHCLWSEGHVPDSQQKITFETKSGNHSALKSHKGITLNFPKQIPHEQHPSESIKNLTDKPILWFGTDGDDIIIEVNAPEDLHSLRVNFAGLASMPFRGLLATCQSIEKDFDFEARCFFPALGIEEDPVTGSAYCSLGPYWSQKLGKETLKAKQVSSREGIIEIHILENRVELTGKALTIIQGQLAIEQLKKPHMNRP